MEKLSVVAVREAGAGRYELCVNSYVGVVALDHVRLTLYPKFGLTGEQLMGWLRHADGQRPRQAPMRRGWQAGQAGVTDLMAAAMVDAAKQMIRQGLRRDYRPHDKLETVLRGRLDVRQQATRRYGMVDRLHVRTFDRHLDIWENQVCHEGLRACRRLASDPALAREAAQLAEHFPPHPHGARGAVTALRHATYHRMNQTYQEAHTWARHILGGNQLNDLLRDEGVTAGSLLIDMDTVWERLIQRVAAEAAALMGGGVQPVRGEYELRVSGDGVPSRALTPDVLIRYGSPERLLPVDAKYKIPSIKAISRDDLYQLLTYAAAYADRDRPQAVAVQPTMTGWNRRSVRVTGPRGLLGEVSVVGVDISRPPEEWSAPLRDLLVNLLELDTCLPSGSPTGSGTTSIVARSRPGEKPLPRHDR
ncbi:McrC family protein [Actinoplanes sp. CA-252034]|uniref:McrC family protein n=1 Tax=Actinoplanes sp. CA-252034 TaxID=3239906 RepID=UPI003D977D6F